MINEFESLLNNDILTFADLYYYLFDYYSFVFVNVWNTIIVLFRQSLTRPLIFSHLFDVHDI